MKVGAIRGGLAAALAERAPRRAAQQRRPIDPQPGQGTLTDRREATKDAAAAMGRTDTWVQVNSEKATRAIEALLRFFSDFNGQLFQLTRDSVKSFHLVT